MSLINKMLQDLDARGSQGSEPMHGTIKSVVRPEARLPMPLVAGVALGVGVLAVAGVLGWRYFGAAPAPVAPTVIVASAAPAPLAPAPVTVAAPAVATATTVAVVQTTKTVPLAVPVAIAEKPLPSPVVEQTPPRPRPVAPARLDTAVDTPRPAAAASERPMAAPQRAESEYRRALASLQEGRIGDSIARLEQALQLDPRHEAARQTLVGLLMEDRRPDEAMAQMQAALTIDAGQTALAMLLARMQIERGGTGIDTLQRSLPGARGNADYHALLAGALQRAQRHGEAAEQYRAALRIAPDNGVWLMGMGISLQAEKRHPDAIDAYQRAKAGGKLTPQLQAFVDTQLQQLHNRGQTSD